MAEGFKRYQIDKRFVKDHKNNKWKLTYIFIG